MRMIQRHPSIAHVMAVPGGHAPLVSHLMGDYLALCPHPTRQGAMAYVAAIWPEVRWVSEERWARAMKGGE